MADRERVLSPSAIRAFYDRFGKKQDSQAFYENPALDDLIGHADFKTAGYVFEFGCGTGRFALQLVERLLPASSRYLGYDLSPVMLGLAGERLAPYPGRAQVLLSDGAVHFPLADYSVDRVVSCYVLDLLSEQDIRRFFSEAQRVLLPGGRVCLACLTPGVGLPSRLLITLWRALFRLNPAIVGGCRPIQLERFVDPQVWRILHRRVLVPFGVPSEVLILQLNDCPDNGL